MILNNNLFISSKKVRSKLHIANVSVCVLDLNILCFIICPLRKMLLEIQQSQSEKSLTCNLALFFFLNTDDSFITVIFFNVKTQFAQVQCIHKSGPQFSPIQIFAKQYSSIIRHLFHNVSHMLESLCARKGSNNKYEALMTPTDQCWIMCQASVIQTINLITTSHFVQGVTQANSNPHLVNYTKQGWRSPGEPVRLLSLCSWSMTVFQHTNYSETVVQLCGGLALSHTISTTINCQRDTEQA